MADASDTLARLKQTCVFIPGPDGTGTGYLVAHQRIGTAAHVVRSWVEGQRYPVTVGVGGTVCQARLLKVDASSDSAVLAFDEELSIEPLPIGVRIDRNVLWEGYGFPLLAAKSGATGLPLDGQIKDPDATNDVGQSAILLYSESAAAGSASPLHGFSGSPVVVAGTLVGHLTKHIGDPDDRRRAAYGYVYACPIRAVVDLLDVTPRKVAVDPPRLETRAEVIPQIATDAYHVFVSYRSTDRAWALSLVARLEGAGLKVFIDQRELEAGEYLAKQLESGLARSRAAVVLVSKGWLESPWCQQEANVLIKRAVEDKSFKLVPLRIDQSAMPALLDARLWLDFNGTTRPEGENLDRLLDAVIGRKRQPDSPVARADLADVKVVDRFVREIRNAALQDEREIFRLLGEWRKLSSPDVAPLVAAAEVLNGKGSFEAALQVLEGATESVRVRQLRAFALRKSGRVTEGIQMLGALRDEGELDAETAGLLAGSYKQQWSSTRDGGLLLLAYELYAETHERTGDPFNGINAAALALQRNDHYKMARFAGNVLDSLLKRPRETLSYWDLATVGEAYLLSRRFDDAADWYAKAAAKATGLHQDIAVMRRQARMNLRALNAPAEACERIDAALPVPCVLAYFGHMVDRQRPTPRFPANKVGAVRAALQKRVAELIEKRGRLHGFGQAACGTDLIVLEELVRRGLTSTVVLPFPAADFVETSVGAAWCPRFTKLQADLLIKFREPLEKVRPPEAALPNAFGEANREVQKLAVQYAARLDQKPMVLAVWDGQPGDGPGGTADAVQLWRDEAYDVDIIDITRISER